MSRSTGRTGRAPRTNLASSTSRPLKTFGNWERHSPTFSRYRARNSYQCAYRAGACLDRREPDGSLPQFRRCTHRMPVGEPLQSSLCRRSGPSLSHLCALAPTHESCRGNVVRCKNDRRRTRIRICGLGTFLPNLPSDVRPASRVDGGDAFGGLGDRFSPLTKLNIPPRQVDPNPKSRWRQKASPSDDAIFPRTSLRRIPLKTGSPRFLGTPSAASRSTSEDMRVDCLVDHVQRKLQ